MQGRNNYTKKLFLSFRLSDRIPKENLYRRLREKLDLSFLYKETKELYGKTGNPSIDPVVFFKLLITGYLENITSDRKLVEHCCMRMDVLYFLGFEIDEDLPWHLTISRTRQLYPSSLFETLFSKVFALCVDSGMVSGHTQAVDSAPIKANASMESVVPKMPATPMDDHLKKVSEENQETAKKHLGTVSPARVSAPEHELKRVEKHHRNLRDSPVRPAGASHKKARLLSNKTHYNPHDPDARISVKPGKARKLNYHCSMAVDTAEGVISHIQADFTDGRDSQYLIDISLQVQDRLRKNELVMTDLLADAGYSNGANYDFLEQRKVAGWIPVFGRYKPKIKGFPYNREKDEYRCPMNRPLPFKGFHTNRDSSVLKSYWAAPKDCKVCPMKSQCVPNSKCKKISKTIYDEQYLRAYARQHSDRGKRMKKIRQSTVEPVFGSLTQFYGLRKIGVLGKAGAHKVMLMAAIAFNLKKYLKKGGGKPSIGIFSTVMHTFRAYMNIFIGQIQPRPILQKAP
ncbi:IS1182 family transposase [Maribacter antarcticus]|uniref:IS1182 family transposase n=1 Tax=Maribacter antarcticus TaxID=505250 RepID=UPI00047954DB|nr:IS1182 family transposase [Maribacter antarcticus]